jgi:hypothetical protein
MYFVSIDENRTMKLAEIALRIWEGGKRENHGGGKSKICKYHNVYPCTTIIC